MRELLAAFACVLALPAVAAAEDRAIPHYVLTRTLASPSDDERQVVLLLRVGSDRGGPATSWAAERRVARRHMGDRTVTREWIDGRTCPALAGVVAAIADLPPTRFAPPDAPVRIPPFHMMMTMLRGPAADATGVRVARADYDGAVSRWWGDAERSLAGCWRREPLEIGGGPVGLLLDDAAAERWSQIG